MSRDLTGKTAGGFRLGEILARGASSTVYAAEPTAGGPAAAVKVLGYDLSRDKNAAAKLIAEVQRATAVKHRNLCPVLEVGAVEHKGKRYLYIAMERLTGVTLKARLAGQQGNALPLPVVLQIASDVGGALQAVQRAGGAHRQVGPGAVFLVPPSEADRRADPDAEDRVYLLDLGVALVPTESAKDSPKPGKAPKPLNDVRGLAQLVRDMLGGLPDSVAAGQNAVLPLRWRNRKVPARIDAVLRQALSDGAGSDKGARIESVATLVAELLGVGDALPSLAAWSEDGRATMPPPARSWSLVWAGALAVLGGSVVGYVLYIQEPTPTPPAVVDLAHAAPADLTATGSADQDAGASPASRDGAQGSPPDAATAESPPRVWPKRTGPKIPPLRTLDPAFNAPTTAPAAPPTPGAPAAPAAPAAPGIKTPGQSAPAASPGSAGPAAATTTPPAATNQQPTGSPSPGLPQAQPDRAQEVK